MAFFTFRSSGRGGSSQAELNSSAETVEVMRRRARHRLIGAAVLVALGVIGFPLLFDTQPRPVAVDIPIEIPDKNKSAPVAAPPAASAFDAGRLASAGNTTAGQGAADATVPAHSSLDAREQLVGAGTPRPVASAAVPDKAAADKKAEKKPESAAKPESDSRPEAQKKTAVAKAERPAEKSKDKAPPDKNQDKAATTAAANQSDLPPASRDDLRIARAEEAARARALLQGKSEKEAAAIAEGHFIVQVGAFSEPGLAQATRAKVERAGLRTYTQEAKTANGTWIRVRVGPFATRAEANAAASKIKGLSLPASILTL